MPTQPDPTQPDFTEPDFTEPGLTEPQLVELEDLAVAFATEAGQLITRERPADLGVARTKSSVTDVVTVMDQAAQDLLMRRVREHRPDDAFFGEEEGGAGGTSGLTWVVDPIDGTVNYLYGIPAYAVSVAVVIGDPTRPGAWRPVAGAVTNPVTGEVYRARRGGGAWARVGDGEPRRLTLGPLPDGAAALGTALLGTGFGYDAEVRAWQAAVIGRVLPLVRDIRRIGSAALDLCQVADGRLDAYYERGLNPWDMAAAWLVVEEAGGRVTGVDGPPSAAGVVAGPLGLVEALHDVVREAVAAAGPDPRPTT